MSPTCIQETLNIRSVAVIGAGPCGLAAAKYLVAEKRFSKIEVFEQRDYVGGIWTYSPLSIVDDNFSIPRTKPSRRPDTAIHVDGCDAAQFVSPVYESLETNIPHTLMNYSDQRFPAGTSLFPGHSVVKTYLNTYADELRPFISLSTQVLGVSKGHGDDQPRWEFDLLDLRTNSTRKAVFDAVVIASGHYNDPFIPDIPGLSEFSTAYPGSISHSKFYRRPSQYQGKKVIVVGNSASGIDLSAQISAVCKGPVIVSEKSVPNTPVEERTWAKMVPQITKLETEGRTVYFEDGDIETDIDAVVFCTGYFYSYPFLRGLSPPVTTDGSCVHNLYEHILYIDDPSLAFIGVPQRIVPFPVAEAQSAWVARVWADRLHLPPVSVMRDWGSRTVEEKGIGKTLHNLAFPKDVNYINMLHEWCMTATKVAGLENGGAGKAPPYWDAETAWVRERFPLIKIASRKLGNKKHEVKTLADLGFEYKAWKASLVDESKLL